MTSVSKAILSTVAAGLVAAMVLAVWGCHSAAKQRQRIADLVSKVTVAYEKKDPKAYIDLFCWQGVPGEQKQQALEIAGRHMGTSLLSVSFKALPMPGPQFTHLVEYTDKRDGVRYHPNLTVVGSLDVVSTQERNPDGKITVVYYVGEKEGRLWIVKAIPAYGNGKG